MSTAERRTDLGPPHYDQFLPPVIKANYGKWIYHEIPEPGILVHTAESGDKVYTVRAGSPRLLSIATIRLFADLADKYCGGYLRFTSRNNVGTPTAARSPRCHSALSRLRVPDSFAARSNSLA